MGRVSPRCGWIDRFVASKSVEHASATDLHANDHDFTSPSFGLNAWLVDDMYDQYRADPRAVGESWRELFSSYRPEAVDLGRPANPGPATVQIPLVPNAATVRPAEPAQVARPAGSTDPPEQATPLRGASGRLAANMTASLGVPTATSFRVVPARLLDINRQILNDHLSRAGSPGKVSFTHVIAYAVLEALRAVPVMNSAFTAAPGNDPEAAPSVVHHRHVGLGVAVDLERPDGRRTLMVPVIREADTLDFHGLWVAYEDLIGRVRAGKVGADDLAGATISLTNPGTLGTVQSVPRLMPGQGVIVGVGAIGYPAEWQSADPQVLAELGVSKVVTITSTYDHRIIQGAESGRFLREVHQRLGGEDSFYEQIFEAMGVPYEPVHLHRDRNDIIDVASLRTEKQTAVDALINHHRVRGHLIAQLDPLHGTTAHGHPELDPATHGLSAWDLDREFLTNGLAGSERMRLGDILAVLRDAYCRSVGVEYMHIQEPAQKVWIQDHVEGAPTCLGIEDHGWILERLNSAEALEQFLQTKYIGQKRFSLEGGESAIPVLDAIIDDAAAAGQTTVVIGMAHRGRLNVLINIVGMSYGELFAEFEGDIDPDTVQGSGDVKYHQGFEGKFTGRSGQAIDVILAPNPSHLEAVDPVVEGMARAFHDNAGTGDIAGEHPVLALLVHGDAAFAGEGVSAEALSMSALPGYETGGTVHLVIDNQLGFTTEPESARSSVYATDVAKMVQAPVFHVNGDDPEACVRVGRLGFAFRQRFHKDVVIHMVCYRRYGHNEQDDPSLTQPLLYQLVKEHPSTRMLYTEALVRRGDIDTAEAEKVHEDFSKRLQSALEETRASAPPRPTRLPPPPPPNPPPPAIETGVDLPALHKVVDALDSFPDGFNVHPKLVRVFANRQKLWSTGEVDWALGEALAYGTLLLNGHDVRIAGQDTRRGTFGHRNAAVVDHLTGAEHLPLGTLGPGRFSIYDSLLSEYAALAFEYGYSLVSSDGLVVWEAQFGDFANNAQTIIDEFVAAGQIKWDQASGIVLFLPHGYEGQGPDHSSARIERFLNLCAEDNMQVANATTAAQLFHLLRRQVLRRDRKPLVLFTPKRYLRGREAHSPVSTLERGHFHEVLDDPKVTAPKAVRRVLLASGKVAFDAMGARDEAGRSDIAVVRIEQLYPWPAELIASTIAAYERAAEVVWLQEEPENQGAWTFVRDRLDSMLGEDFALSRVTRAASASPATGSHAMHQLEQSDLLARVLG